MSTVCVERNELGTRPDVIDWPSLFFLGGPAQTHKIQRTESRSHCGQMIDHFLWLDNFPPTSLITFELKRGSLIFRLTIFNREISFSKFFFSSRAGPIERFLLLLLLVPPFLFPTHVAGAAGASSFTSRGHPPKGKSSSFSSSWRWPIGKKGQKDGHTKLPFKNSHFFFSWLRRHGPVQ